jgi:hypothetical protein
LLFHALVAGREKVMATPRRKWLLLVVILTAVVAAAGLWSSNASA